MPPKRDHKVPTAPTRHATKKAPRPATTKKIKQTPANKPITAKKAVGSVTNSLLRLLRDPSMDARSIVDFIVSGSCGIEQKHVNGCSSLQLAVLENRLDVVQLLLSEHSPDINAVNAGGCTALHSAANRSNLDMVKCLVAHGGGGGLINAVDNCGNTPLLHAAMGSQVSTALLLLELGADPIIPNKWQRTPLYYACSNCLVDVAKALLAKGASVNVVDNNGDTPLDWADKWKHEEIISLLKEGTNNAQ